jgi:phosphatidylglycerophosphate synthase
VNDVSTAGDRFVILADESANWKVAGLRQLDRLALALNEFAQSMDREEKIDIIVFWNPKTPVSARWKPPDSLQTRVGLKTESDLLEPGDRILNTYLFVGRNRLEQIVAAAPRVADEPEIRDATKLWNKLASNDENVFRQYCANQRDSFVCDYLTLSNEIATCESRFLREVGKSNDGIVARFLHRPISRAISRVLLKTQITPNAWSIWTMIVPLVGCAFLCRGTYAGFIIGTALYQFHNLLDGCDGEIARAKYLDSERGRKIDAFCDLASTVLLALSMGIGLWRYQADNPASLFYFVEGFVAAVLLSLTWWISHRSNTSFGHLSRRALGFKKKSEFSPLHESPKTISGRARWLLVEATKRDVSHFLFLLMALAGAAAWILHFLFAYAFIGCGLTVIALSLSSSSSPAD